jgi:hypothetical protein
VRWLETITLEPGEERIDTIRLTHRTVEEVYEHEHGIQGYLEHAHMGLRSAPDILGHYPVDERTLPPGVSGQSMITIVDEVDGLALGGVTYTVTVEDGGRKPRPAPPHATRAKR